MKYYCNPLNVNYRYQFNADPRNGGKLQICREAADPSLIYYQDRYWMFASMSLGVWVSDDLVNWENHRLPENLPLYDYAPDVRVIKDYVYFCASSREKVCDYYRTKDILNGPYEQIKGTFPFWDPNLFVDDDERVYFYWGCSNVTPVYGVEVDPKTLKPMGDKKDLIAGNPYQVGYERIGENNSILPADEAEIEAKYKAFISRNPMPEENLSEEIRTLIRGMFTNRPYIEGAWMTKYKGLYYLQYAAPGTQYNTYSDGVYIGKTPLGPFTLAPNNPYSYKPGGFIPGAGHGSTMQDKHGYWWHTSTMRISKNHDFERRVGLWPAGFDADGELFCNQRYGDWPMNISLLQEDPFHNPEWFLLSSKKKVTASSFVQGNEPEKAAEENVQTWWRAKGNGQNEWIMMDLEQTYRVHAIQVNFADDAIDIPCPGEISSGTQARYIEERNLITQWKLEGSNDGSEWFVIADKANEKTDLSHDLVIIEEGINLRYLRLSNITVPYEQAPCISGIRVFGVGNGEKPCTPQYEAVREEHMDMIVSISEQPNTVGYNILFGSSEQKLYHNMLVYKAGKHRIGALIEGREYYIRVDAFNENGITEGVCKKLEDLEI